MPYTPASYPLSRSHISTTRLIAQHALWQHDLRFLLHPNITASLNLFDSTHKPITTATSADCPPPSAATPLRIADLATGTALWALSLLQQYAHAKVTASDISLAQAPPSEWLPQGLELREWDIYNTLIPEDWVGQFDAVHIRLALLVIRNNDAQSILERAWRMLKPGGWMQWDELDPEGASTIVAENAGMEEEDVKRFQRMQELTAFEGLKWVRRLEGAFESAGFDSVGREVFDGEKSAAGFYQSMQFLVMEEEGMKRGEEAREKVARDIEWGVQTSTKGIARVVPKVVVWGRKTPDKGEEKSELR